MSSVQHSASDAPALRPGGAAALATALAAVAILALALAFRAGMLGRPPEFDELYHLIAAKSWLETGQLAILDGAYTRTSWFTRATAWLFALTGSTSLETGRLLPLAAGILIPPVLFLWLRARAGWTAALIGAALAILWPQGIEEAQTLRFYSWQALTFLLGGIAAFEAVERPRAARAARWAWAALALASLWVALYLQINTAIGIAGILAWIGLAAVLPAAWTHPRRWLILGGLAALGLAALAGLAATGILAELWEVYRRVPGWAANQQDNWGYYHFYLLRTYPVPWPLFPLAALLAFRQQPRLVGYCCVVFAAIFLGQSFGGMKSLRYLSGGMPFLFAVLAVALAEVLPAAATAASAAARHLNPTRWGWVAGGIVAGVASVVALANPFVEISLKAPFGRGAFGTPEADWTRMDDLLAEWQVVPFRMTMRELHTIDALGDYDVLIADSRLDEIEGGAEFAVDPRTGRPVVGDPLSVAAILRCEPEGVLLAETGWWEAQGWGLELLPLFAAAGREVETRRDRTLLALHWSGGPPAAPDCALPMP